MKKMLLTLIPIAAIGLSSFVLNAVNGSYTVKTSESKIGWLGKKVTGQHNGFINLSGGNLEVSDNKLTGGKFTIDMNSITCVDIEDEDMNQKLVGHLKSDDFFGVEKHKSATFVITSAVHEKGDSYKVTGNLTIKDITNKIEFPATVKVDGDKVVATAKITVDRSKYDVKYGSGSFFDNLGDKMIYDDFELDVTLIAKK